MAEFLDEAMSLGIEGIMVSPGYSYERAPRQDVFLERSASKRLFREIFKRGRHGRARSRWSFNYSGLFLDFLAGNQGYQCTPWSTPTYNIFGWQRPCYLLSGEGYASSFHSLMAGTEWENYGVGRNPACDNCMAHCGFEGTAVDDAFTHPLKALTTALRGPRHTGPMAADLLVLYRERTPSRQVCHSWLRPVAMISSTTRRICGAWGLVGPWHAIDTPPLMWRRSYAGYSMLLTCADVVP